MPYFIENCQGQMIEGVDWWTQDDMTLVVDKALEKLFKPSLKQLQDYINTEQFIKDYNRRMYQQVYNSYVPTKDTNHWSLETWSFYAHEHELANIDVDKYNITPFDDLPQDPLFITKRFGNREWKQYELAQIAGVVLDRNDPKHTLTILDMGNHVVQVKFTSASDYAFYKQQLAEPQPDGKSKVVDASWFKRGQPLILTGVRIGENDFSIKAYKSSIYQHKVQKILSVGSNGELKIQSYRYGYGPDDV